MKQEGVAVVAGRWCLYVPVALFYTIVTTVGRYFEEPQRLALEKEEREKRDAHDVVVEREAATLRRCTEEVAAMAAGPNREEAENILDELKRCVGRFGNPDFKGNMQGHVRGRLRFCTFPADQKYHTDFYQSMVDIFMSSGVL